MNCRIASNRRGGLARAAGILLTTLTIASIAGTESNVLAQDPGVVPPPPPSSALTPRAFPSAAPDSLIPPSPGEAPSAADFEVLEAQLRSHLETSPGDEEAIIQLAIVLKRLNRDYEAMHLLSDAMAANIHSTRIAMALGQLYLEADCVAYALRMFESVQCVDPCHDDLHYWLGSARLKSGMPLCAYRTLLYGQHSSEQVAHAQQLVRGAALANLGLQCQASAEFMGIYHHSADPELQSRAWELQNQMDTALETFPRLRGSLKYGVRFDDNPGIVPSSNALGLVPANAGPSWGNSVVGQFSYDLYRGYNRDLIAGYTLFHTTNFSNHAFDLVDNAVFLAAAQRGLWRDTPYVAGLRMDYDHLGVGSRAFLGRTSVTSTFTTIDSDFSSTTVLSRHTLLDYLGQGPLDNTVLDADSNNYSAGLFRQYRLPEQDVQLLFGYLYDRNFSQGGNIDYNGHNLQAGMAWLLPYHDIQINVLGQVYFRDYVNPDVIAMQRRRDVEYVLQSSILYPLNDHWFATFSWLLDRNTSNLAASDYDRQVFELGLQYNFPQGHALDPSLLRRRTTY